MEKIQDLRRIRTELEEKRRQLLMSTEKGQSDDSGEFLYNLDRTDLANEYRSKERREALHTVEQKTLQQVEQALARIDSGTYGLCRNCEQPINDERLAALPYATLCIDCQTQLAHKSGPAKSLSR
ncbi:MAG: TraR/DksA C4-type zinc finger protein [Caldilineaceae bacterium]